MSSLIETPTGLRRYNTPEFATLALLNRVHIDGRICEPMSGEGAITNVLQRHLEKNRLNDPLGLPAPVRGLYTNDLDHDVIADNHLDACLPSNWPKISGGHRSDWIVSNPEFNIANEFVPVAFDVAKLGIALLLRITWMEPTDDRGAWLAEHPPSHLIVIPRLSFKTVITDLGNGKFRKSSTDSTCTAWYVWYKFPCQQKLEIVSKGELKWAAQSRTTEVDTHSLPFSDPQK